MALRGRQGSARAVQDQVQLGIVVAGHSRLEPVPLSRVALYGASVWAP